MSNQTKKLNKEKINFLRPIGLPLCFTCHHEMIHERFNYTPCTEKCGKWFNSGQSSNLDNEKWAIEFDKIFVDKVSLESGSSPLFRNRYLVTDVKQFISNLLTKCVECLKKGIKDDRHSRLHCGICFCDPHYNENGDCFFPNCKCHTPPPEKYECECGEEVKANGEHICSEKWMIELRNLYGFNNNSVLNIEEIKQFISNLLTKRENELRLEYEQKMSSMQKNKNKSI